MKVATAGPAPVKREVIHIKGMHCASCVARVEKALAAVPGVDEAVVNLATEKAVVTVGADGPSAAALAAAVLATGYEAEPVAQAAGLRDIFRAQSRESWGRFLLFLLTAALSIPVIVVSMAEIHFAYRNWALLALTTGAVFAGGFGIIRRALRQALSLEADMDTLVALGALTAYGYSLALMARGDHMLYFETSVAVLTFVLLGRWLESAAKGRATRSIKKLLSIVPRKAALLRGPDGGDETSVDVADIVEGDVLLVRPGERVPVDGEVLGGESTLDESVMTGETRPVAKARGDLVLAGTINNYGALRITARRVGGDTALAHIIRMVERAQAAKPPIQRFADRVASVFVPAVLLVSVITFIGWCVANYSAGPAAALMPAIAVLLVSCPCALGLATPTAVTVGVGLAAERGIMIRNAASLERLYSLDAIVLDKTGTLTQGREDVTDLVVVPGEDADELVALAASVESASEHSLSRAIVRFAKNRMAAFREATGFEALAGMGVRATVDGRQVVVGNAALIHEMRILGGELEDEAARLRAEGKTVVYTATDGRVRGILALSDVVKPSARAVIEGLRGMGLKVLMVTGDTRETALAIGRQAGIPPQEILSEVRPQDKALVVKQLRKEREQVGMVGDGINDAPALAEADVGIAMGTGTDVAIETADVTLSRGDLTALLEAIAVSRLTMRAIKQNLFWAFAYNVILIPVAAFGLLNPMYAALAMSFSSVMVVTNSLRIRRMGRRRLGRNSGENSGENA
ncbi:MAG: copper-translocating P-type ATPase [Deltaproteobacteria bacterium]|nr:copper-translocating P-type ATPase [Deltaproteobacteria bacterium]